MLLKKILYTATTAITIAASSLSAQANSITLNDINRITLNDKRNSEELIGGLQVSPDLFKIIEEWQRGYAKVVSLENFVMNKDSEVFESWIDNIIDNIGEINVLNSFERNHLDVYKSAMKELSVRVGGKILLQWTASVYPETFENYQQQELKPARLDLENYLQENSDHLLRTWQEANSTPINQNSNGTFSKFINNRNLDLDLAREGDLLLDHYYTKDISEHCACEVVTTFQHSGYSAVVNPNVIVEGNLIGDLKEQRYIKQVKNGAAHSANLVRFKKHGANEISKIDSSYLRAKTTILCLSSIGGQCETGSCSGEIDLQAEYGSKLMAKTSANGSPLSASKALASDSAVLKYDPPGAAPEQKLFNKGLVLTKRQATDFDVTSFANFIESAVGIAATFAPQNATLADLDTSLVNAGIQAFFGIIQRDGQNGEYHQNFYVEYDTNTASAIQISSDETHTFELSTNGQVYSNGWGGTSSWGWSSYYGSYWLVGAVKNFSCDEGVIPPSRAGFWSYATANGPYSNNLMVNNINAFLITELGYSGTIANGTSTTGVLTMDDPKYPVADCDIAPSTMYGPGTAALFGGNSFDPDGTIVAYEWFVNGNPVGNSSTVIESFPGTTTYMTSYPVSLKVTDNSGLTSTQSCGSVNICAPTGCVAEGTVITYDQ